MKIGAMVYVRWLDSGMASGWQKAPTSDTGISEIESVGYLVFEDKEHIQIALSRQIGFDWFNAILGIPKSVILKIRRLKIK